MALNNLWSYTILVENMIFWYFRQHIWNKKLWFSKRQEFHFVFFPLPPTYSPPETILQIKHFTT